MPGGSPGASAAGGSRPRCALSSPWMPSNKASDNADGRARADRARAASVADAVSVIRASATTLAASEMQTIEGRLAARGDRIHRERQPEHGLVGPELLGAEEWTIDGDPAVPRCECSAFAARRAISTRPTRRARLSSRSRGGPGSVGRHGQAQSAPAVAERDPGRQRHSRFHVAHPGRPSPDLLGPSPTDVRVERLRLPRDALVVGCRRTPGRSDPSGR